MLFIAYWISKNRGWHQAFQLIIPLFLLQIVVALYVYDQGVENGIYYYRNFLFIGLPYFLLGAFLRNLLGTKRIKALRRKRSYLLGSLLFLFIADYAVITSNTFSALTSFGFTFITIKIEATLLFLLALLYPQKSPSLLSKIGERYSLYIYILHPLFLYNLLGWRTWLHTTFGESYLYLFPLLVVILSISLGKVVAKIREWRRVRKLGNTWLS